MPSREARIRREDQVAGYENQLLVQRESDRRRLAIVARGIRQERWWSSEAPFRANKELEVVSGCLLFLGDSNDESTGLVAGEGSITCVEWVELGVLTD
jgi:hypothetical protein